jgi:hypothetical protein
MYKLENETNEKIKNLIRTISCELSDFSNEINKLKQSDKSELYLLKQEIGSLLEDKRKIKISLISIDSRLTQMEIDVGKDYIL